MRKILRQTGASPKGAAINITTDRRVARHTIIQSAAAGNARNPPAILPARVADAAGDRLELLFDGGVRSGPDMVKALALTGCTDARSTGEKALADASMKKDRPDGARNDTDGELDGKGIGAIKAIS